MSNLVTRAGKGSPLTHAEMDGNLEVLNADKLEDPSLDPLRQADTALEGRIAAMEADTTTLTHRVDAMAQDMSALQPIAEKGMPDGYAPLDGNRKIPPEHLPDGGSGSGTSAKGWFSTPAALRAAHPVAASGDNAIVGSTDSVWVWDADRFDWTDTDTRGQVSQVNGKTGDVQLVARDVPLDTPPGMTSADVQTAIEELYARPGVAVDVFTSAGTWIKRPGAKVVKGMILGAGAGGASGSVNVDSQLAQGGGGGSGAARTEFELDATTMPASCAVTVGYPGTGGAASSGGFNNGSAGGSSSVYIGSALYSARGGNAGSGPAGPSGVDGLFSGGTGGAGGGATNRNGAAGRGSITTGTGSTGGGGPGAGGGGALLADNSEGQGGGAAYSTVYASPTASPGDSGGASGGGHGLDAATAPSYSAYLYPGISGGGGGANLSGNGGNGGNGGGFGAGGGGGGAARTGFMSGRGGNGSPGIVIIITYF